MDLAVPFDIPVGGFVEPRRHFLAPAAVIAMGTLRILSSDPDEGSIDVPVQGFGFVQTLAAPDRRGALFEEHRHSVPALRRSPPA